VTWWKGTKVEDLDDISVTWTGQANMNTGTATDESIEEQTEVHGQLASKINFVHKN
jgi:hypothetical protein